ncbi:pyruvate dehydrogenase complex dihydrolipoamide acetyltransferase [Niabella yanshanensis]|uniref:Acetyltransferase component of pyruvate dehydrogenase complex n=1 Tax=Niabella yanshanensis TaxID=577386 RepID=A0ABZ0W330_9BACT|nr:pyruvate dehydrogenase complex dihydrolipoamide acetyltransferase [Niabella yanshanensis]WQD37657.1 pyruvate dehydrogenase complex dihydrolipoamide acetyltransferase [Niabella yanshanensis]
MADKILMPRLSDTMTEGVIAAWHKKVGDSVKKGDLLAEIETDKATMELESYKDGTILYLGADTGGKLQVDDLMVIVGDAGEDISGLVNGKLGGSAEVKEEKKEEPAKEAAKTEEKAATAPSGSTIDVSKLEEVVLMPRLSDTMTEGVIASWAKNIGDDVKKGDLLAEIETDKATMELESYKNGKLLYQGAKAGDKIQVNDLLCIIGEEGKVNVDEIVAAVKGGGAAPTPTAEAKEETAPETKEAAPASSSAPAVTTGENGRIKASPLAKKLAAEKGIDLGSVQGSGDGGRITKSDIDNYKPSASKPATSGNETTTAPAATGSAVTGQVSFEDVPVSQMRKTIARRLSEVKFSAPEIYLTMEINMDKAVASRAQINEVSPNKISFNDLVIKAAALALKQHPDINSSWQGDTIRVNHHVDIGVAVAVDQGLLVPVVRFADTKSLSQIAGEVKDLAGRAKSKKLAPAEWEGNTFTISNLGMFGIEEFTAIINPPASCILAVGAINQVPVVRDGQITVGNIMKVTLTCDHRVADGAVGAAFLQTLKSFLEEPLRMLV